MNSIQTQRRDDIIRFYKTMTISQIAKIYDVSTQRIYQIIQDFEREEGVSLKRHKSQNQQMVWKWNCQQCGEERLLAFIYKAKKCIKCRLTDSKIQDDIIEKWIEQRRNGRPWRDIYRDCGYPDSNNNSIAKSVYSYLRRNNRLNEVKVIWKGYSTRWLAQYFPDDAIFLRMNKADGRHLGNGGRGARVMKGGRTS